MFNPLGGAAGAQSGRRVGPLDRARPSPTPGTVRHCKSATHHHFLLPGRHPARAPFHSIPFLLPLASSFARRDGVGGRVRRQTGTRGRGVRDRIMAGASCRRRAGGRSVLPRVFPLPRVEMIQEPAATLRLRGIVAPRGSSSPHAEFAECFACLLARFTDACAAL